MKKIREKLLVLLVWAANRVRPDNTLILLMSTDLLEQARSVVAFVDADVSNASPENKHARAFAMLHRVAPDHPKKDVALAIELALRT